ncbi:hypothetical protein LINGRAHAP2_LOCUS15277 [Linum grandiflorum]
MEELHFQAQNQTPQTPQPQIHQKETQTHLIHNSHLPYHQSCCNRRSLFSAKGPEDQARTTRNQSASPRPSIQTEEQQAAPLLQQELHHCSGFCG